MVQRQKNRDVIADCSIHYVGHGHPIIEQSLDFFCVEKTKNWGRGIM